MAGNETLAFAFEGAVTTGTACAAAETPTGGCGLVAFGADVDALAPD